MYTIFMSTPIDKIFKSIPYVGVNFAAIVY